jgi:hypothetical protein
MNDPISSRAEMTLNVVLSDQYFVFETAECNGHPEQPCMLSKFNKCPKLCEMQPCPYHARHFLHAPIKKRPSSCKPLNYLIVVNLPGRIRTSDLMVRSHALYPAGLRADGIPILT